MAEMAAAWVLEEEAGLSVHRNSMLEAWLAEADDHAKAYHQARSAYDAVGRQGADAEIMALREAALRARPERFGRPSGRIAASLAALTIIAGGGWWALDHGRASRTPMTSVAQAGRYQTAVGERSTVTLPDGSLMTLNTSSLAQVSYDPTERTVRLLSGQAMFTVAHGQDRPFRVYAGDRVITATGTAFEVYLQDDSVRVALLEGVVEVTGRAGGGGPSRSAVETLSAGEVLTAAPDQPTRVRGADVERLSGWRQGLVAFDDTPLTEAVAEINRYTLRPIVLGDPGVGRNRVSGTFRVGEPERFARTMTELFPVEMTSSDNGQTILSAEPG